MNCEVFFSLWIFAIFCKLFSVEMKDSLKSYQITFSCISTIFDLKVFRHACLSLSLYNNLIIAVALVVESLGSIFFFLWWENFFFLELPLLFPFVYCNTKTINVWYYQIDNNNACACVKRIIRTFSSLKFTFRSGYSRGWSSVPIINMIEVIKFQRSVKCFVKGNKSLHFVISNVKINTYFLCVISYIKD